VGGDAQRLAAARERVRAEAGPAALVDALAVASNFERMVRIADGTGLPLDAPMNLLSGDIQRELRLDRFAAAALTPRLGAFGRLAGRVLRPFAPRLFARLGRRAVRVR
jgi:hypothetical protein